MNCPHHVSWIVPVAYGQHQCTLCWEIVAKKDITPKFDDLGPALQAKWDAHEKQGAPAAAAPAAKPAAAPAKPAAAAQPPAPATAPAPAAKPSA